MRWLPVVLLVALGPGAALPGLAGPSCLGLADLDAWFGCLKESIAGIGSQGYDAPLPAERAAWAQLAGGVVAGNCPSVAAGDPLFGEAVTTVVSDGASHCILMETLGDGVVHGWGALVVADVSGREVDLSAPHPLYDVETGEQAVGLYRDTGARGLAVAGAHRYATLGLDASFSSDVANTPDSMFQESVRAMAASGTGVHVQMHGMAAAACPGVDIYLSDGELRPPATTSTIRALRDALRAEAPQWTTITYGDAPCTQSGSQNFNKPVVEAAGLDWIHVEQVREVREGPWPEWVAAIDAAALGQ